MKVNYTLTSPYSTTDQQLWYLEIMKQRNIKPDITDKDYEIPAKYNHRPDLAAFGLYGNTEYWWVFALVNKNTLIDPIYDFTTGTTIQVPMADRVKNMR